MPRSIKIIAAIFIIGLSLFYFFHSVNLVWRKQMDTQWDLLTYYYAGKTAEAGLNPYRVADLNEVSGLKIYLPYLYIPAFLKPIQVIDKMEYGVVHRLWLIMKILALAALISLWKMKFIKATPWVLLIPFTFFAFDGTIFWDIKAGNISMFEQLALWFALFMFLRNKYFWFTALILAISLFKLTPILFLALLLISDDKDRYKFIVAGLSGFVLILLFDYILERDLFIRFIMTLREVNERAVYYNYGLLAFWQDFFDIFHFTSQQVIHTVMSYGFYCLSVVAILFYSVRKFRDRKRSNHIDFRLPSIFFACCTYALIMPRMKCYAFIILIPVVLYLVSSLRNNQFSFAIIILGLIPIASPYFESETIMRMYRYFPLSLAALFWICLLTMNFEAVNIEKKYLL